MTYETEWYFTKSKQQYPRFVCQSLTMCQSHSSNKVQNSYLKKVQDWAKIILKHSQRDGFLTIDAQHKALGAVTLLSLTKYRDFKCDHNFFLKIVFHAQMKGNLRTVPRSYDHLWFKLLILRCSDSSSTLINCPGTIIYFLPVWINYQLYHLVKSYLLPYLSWCYYICALLLMGQYGITWRVLAVFLEHLSNSSSAIGVTAQN